MADEERNEDFQSRAESDDNESAPVPVAPLPLSGIHGGGTSASPAAGAFNLAAPLAAHGAFGHAGDDEDDDMQIADRVEEAVNEDGRLAESHIAIAVSKGTVELAGKVLSEHQRQTAEEICGHVPGVRAVQNRLTVVPSV